jgi:hypothetical protein
MKQIVSTINEITALRKQVDCKNEELKSVKTVKDLDRISGEIAEIVSKMRVKSEMLQMYIENYESVVNVTLA